MDTLIRHFPTRTPLTTDTLTSISRAMDHLRATAEPEWSTVFLATTDIRDFAEEFQDLAIVLAHNSGLKWTQIAAHLRVSKQAVQQRHRKILKNTPRIAEPLDTQLSSHPTT